MGMTSRTLTVALLALAEATWLATGLALVAASGAAWAGPGVGWLWGLIVLAFALGRWVLTGAEDDPRRLRLGLGVALLVVGLAGVRAWSATQTLQPTVLTLLVGGYGWWRGWRLASEGATGSAAQSAFGRGLFFWVVAAVVSAFLAGEHANLVGALMLFVGASLLAMALGALNDARLGSTGTEGPAFDRTWSAVVGVVVAVVVLSGVALAAWLAPDTLEGLLASLQPLARLLAILVEWVLRLLILLLIPLVYLLVWLLTNLRLFELLDELFPQPLREPEQSQEVQQVLLQVPAWVTTLVEVLVIVALVLVALWILRLALQRRQVGEEGSVVETRRIVASRELVAAQLRSLLDNLRARLAARRRDGPFLPLGSGRDARRRIRAAYQAFLAATAARGLTRAPGETPAAFASRLAVEHGAPDAPLIELTAAYEPARYDTAPLDAARAVSAEAATSALAEWLASDDAEPGD